MPRARNPSPKLVPPPREVLSLRRGRLRLAVVADTHSKPHALAAARVRAKEPDAILHGGDIGDLHVLSDFEAIAPTFAVRGNIDVLATDVPDVRVFDVQDEGRVLSTLLLVHIAVYGPKLRAEVRELARAVDAQLVVCGHSHVPFQGRDRGIAVFNPGSIGPRRFDLPVVFGTIEIDRSRVALHHFDVEHGEELRGPPEARLR